jgi:hypothetical protein
VLKGIVTARSKCTANSYCDNNGEVYMHILTGIVARMTKTGRFICSVIIYCDNNGEIYMQY